MAHQRMLHNRKAETHPSGIATSTAINAKESLRQMWNMLGFYAGTGIVDGQSRAISAGLSGQLYFAIRRRMTQRIRQQIDDN